MKLKSGRSWVVVRVVAYTAAALDLGLAGLLCWSPPVLDATGLHPSLLYWFIRLNVISAERVIDHVVPGIWFALLSRATMNVVTLLLCMGIASDVFSTEGLARRQAVTPTRAYWRGALLGSAIVVVVAMVLLGITGADLFQAWELRGR